MVGKLTETVNVLAEDDEMTDHRLDVCEGNIEVLTDRVDLANRGVDNLERQINHIEEEIADIPTDERIQQLQDAIDANSSDIETLDSRVDILESRPDLSSAVAVNTQNISSLQTAVSGKSTVSYNEIVQTGTKIGTITIDGTPTDLYAPSATVIPGADGISYNNSTSGLTATNVQDAIDEVDGAVDTLSSAVAGKSTVSVSQVVSTGTKIATVTVDSVGTDIYAPAQSTPTASQVSYDNTTSGMTASDVQAAIDELDSTVDTKIDVNRARQIAEQAAGNVEPQIYSDAEGSIFQNQTTVSLTSGTSFQNLGYVDVPKNTVALLIVTVRFAFNANGYRKVNISNSSGGSAISPMNLVMCPPVQNSDITSMQLVTLLDTSGVTTGNKRFYVNAAQNSGSTLTVTPRYHLMILSK